MVGFKDSGSGFGFRVQGFKMYNGLQQGPLKPKASPGLIGKGV